MPIPMTGGTLRTNIASMEIGDYIMASFAPTANLMLGAIGGRESLTGYAHSDTGWRDFYFIKVDKGLLVSDRVVSHTVSWDTLNGINLIEGTSKELDGIAGILRSLGGGNSYATADGKSSTADTGNGAWPIDNEFDKYIVGMFEGRDDVWHFDTATWVQETDSIWGSSSSRVKRGWNAVEQKGKYFVSTSSSSSNSNQGFRPIFQYQEGGEG